MDTLQEYIRMCEKATEIQALRPVGIDWELGDFYYFRSLHPDVSDSIDVAGSPNGYDDYDIVHGSGEIWLPRQDQLQNMLTVENDKAPVELLIDSFYRWTRQEHHVSETLSTMERLWLAFVMHQKYGKCWNGEEWQICK